MIGRCPTVALRFAVAWRKPPDRRGDDAPLPVVHAGRGAVSNPAGRYEALDRVTFDDGWGPTDDPDDDAPGPATTVVDEQIHSIIARNDSPDVPFDRSINPYRGCEHGCIYCFARPTHAYHDLSPGEDFETKLFAKPDAPALLRTELSKRSYVCKPIAFGTNTDPYQPIETDWRVTRGCIELLAETDHPLTITTKSNRVLRDLDLLAPMAAKGLAAVMLSITSLDPRIAMTLEPRAPHPEKRLAAVKALSAAGIPTFVSISPIIPSITDHEMEAIIERAADAGARAVFFIPVRLPHEVAPLFRAWLDTHFPDRAAKVMATIQSLRGGRDNDPGFHTRMQGQGAWAQLLQTRFRIATRRYGLEGERITLRTDLFRPPAGDQGELF